MRDKVRRKLFLRCAIYVVKQYLHRMFLISFTFIMFEIYDFLSINIHIHKIICELCCMYTKYLKSVSNKLKITFLESIFLSHILMFFSIV